MPSAPPGRTADSPPGRGAVRPGAQAPAPPPSPLSLRGPGAQQAVGAPSRFVRQVRSQLAQVVAGLPGGGEARPGQAAMAEGVAEALAAERHLVVRAGTGTGKTLAYLVPAVLSRKRVVVATATKALQDQLASKDLPFLAAHLDHPFTWAILKGRSNYVCVQRLAEVDRTGTAVSISASRIGPAPAGLAGAADSSHDNRRRRATTTTHPGPAWHRRPRPSPAGSWRSTGWPAGPTRPNCARSWPGRRPPAPATGPSCPTSPTSRPGRP